MPEASRFFDSTPDDIREYVAEDFAEYFRRLVTNGIFNGGTNLQVGCDGSNIMTYLNPGYAWIEGYMYKVYNENFYVQHDLPDANNDRIDRVVLRLDKSLETRTISVKILKGIPASSPVAPALTRNDNVYEISLAQVRIIKGKSYIEGSQITDERLNTSVCGLVNSLIQADTTNIFNQFNDWYNSKTSEFQTQWNNWFTTKTVQYNTDWQSWFGGTQDEWDTWFSAQQQQGYVLESQKGQAGGVASLDGGGKVPLAQLPDLSIKSYVGQATGSVSILANGTVNLTIAVPNSDFYDLWFRNTSINNVWFKISKYDQSKVLRVTRITTTTSNAAPENNPAVLLNDGSVTIQSGLSDIFGTGGSNIELQKISIGAGTLTLTLKNISTTNSYTATVKLDYMAYGG